MASPFIGSIFHFGKKVEEKNVLSKREYASALRFCGKHLFIRGARMFILLAFDVSIMFVLCFHVLHFYSNVENYIFIFFYLDVVSLPTLFLGF